MQSPNRPPPRLGRWLGCTLVLVALCLPRLGAAQSTLISGHQVIVGSENYCAATLTGSNYACNLLETITEYNAGATYRFLANAANAGAVTLQLNGIASPVPLVKFVNGANVALLPNDIRAGALVTVIHDGTNMQVQSVLGQEPQKSAVFACIDDATALTPGDGKCYIPVPPGLNGWAIVQVTAHVGAVVSSAGIVTVDIDRCAAVATGIRCSSGTIVSIFSTLLTVDANEDGSETATASVINAANATLATGQWLRVNIDGAGTGTQGLTLTFLFRST